MNNIYELKENCYVISYTGMHDRESLMLILKDINIEGKFICFLHCRFTSKHIHRYNEIAHLKKYADENNLKFFLIYYNMFDVISYKYGLKKFADKLKNEHKIDYNQQIILSITSQDDFLKVIPSLEFFAMIAAEKNRIHNNSPYFEKVNSHFVFLNRVVKPHRVYAFVEIFERNLDKYGACSFAAGYSVSENENEKSLKLLPEKYRKNIPLLIDGMIISGNELSDTIPLPNIKIHGAMFNIVAETSFDYDICKEYMHDQFSPSITEKSSKPFLWRQIPIFITVKNNLLLLREFGFDLFDDVIDHSYDNEDDGIKRIKLAIDQLKKVCEKDLDYWNKFREENKSRFEHNFNLLEKFYDSKWLEFTKQKFIEAIL